MTHRERGLRGYHALVARYGEAQVRRWRRKGGRRRNPTLAEIEAGAGRRKAAVARTREASVSEA